MVDIITIDPAIVPRLPSRYEDLDEAFRGRLRANGELLAQVQAAYQSMQISGGIRFLPIYGRSGSGKTSAALELGTHLPEARVVTLPRITVESREELESFLRDVLRTSEPNQLLIAVVDQYEEAAAQRANVPTSFVETLSLLDRGELRAVRMLFIWLTTDRSFQRALADATSRNRRILVSADFELIGPPSSEWPGIVEETFRFHNQERDLSDYEIISEDLVDISRQVDTIGQVIEQVGERLSQYATRLHDLSKYQVIMLWPVTDGLRISRVQQFTDARQGYKLDWNAWARQLNAEDRKQLPLREYNRARLYFDMRVVPIAAADLQELCRDLDEVDATLHKTYLERFSNTHFFSIAKGAWNPDNYSPLRERESQRAEDARAWYETVTGKPTQLGRRLARCLNELGVQAGYEETLTSPHGKVRADILVDRAPGERTAIVELKAYSAENTMPSTIAEQVKVTLRRHAAFAGFIQRQ
jgi:hypothetical protein